MGRIACVLFFWAWLMPLSLVYGQGASKDPMPCGGGAGTLCPPVEMTDAVTQLEAEQADLTLNLAHSLAKEKRYREALEGYQEFVRLFPHSARLREARENMARIYERRQRYDKAIDQYEALYRELGVSPLGLAYHLEAARLHEIAGDETAAVNIYKELNQIDPGSDAAARARTRMEALHLLQKAGGNSMVEATPQP